MHEVDASFNCDFQMQFASDSEGLLTSEQALLDYLFSARSFFPS